MDIISTVIMEGEVGSVCVGLSDVPTNGTEVAINVTFTVGNGNKTGRHRIHKVHHALVCVPAILQAYTVFMHCQ